MNVTVSVFARFHAFYLANQLYKEGHLKKLITTYPKFEVGKYDIPTSKVSSLLRYELAHRLWNRQAPNNLKNKINLHNWLFNSYSRAAAHKIPEDTDIYVGWTGSSIEGLKKAKIINAISILDRGSAHSEYHRNILREEYELQGIEAKVDSDEKVERDKYEYSLADYITVPSKFAYKTFLEYGFKPEQLIVNNLGVDLSQFRQVAKEDSVFRVVFAGSMSLQKGVHYLLQAFSELNLPNSELWLLGSKKPEIDAYFKKYEGKFKYFGHIPQSQLHEYYSQCSVFVLNSIQDGFGMVIPQAMACGLPVICSENTGGPDLIENGKQGFIIPVRDVEKLKEYILWLYENDEARLEMSSRAKKSVEQGFSWDDYGERSIKNYQYFLNL